MSIENSHQISDVKVLLARGIAGNGIASISKTGTTGDVDTYTITMDDGTLYIFTVTNGTSIASITKTGTVGLTDTYTITLTDGSTSTFTVTNGSTTAYFDEGNAEADGGESHKISIAINGTKYSWHGMTYTDKTVTLSDQADTTITMDSYYATANSEVDVYTSEYGLTPSSVSVSSGQITLVFDKQDTEKSVDIRVYLN